MPSIPAPSRHNAWFFSRTGTVLSLPRSSGLDGRGGFPKNYPNYPGCQPELPKGQGLKLSVL